MTEKKMTFSESVKASWKNELRIGNPLRIIRLAFATVFYSLVHFFATVFPRYLKRLMDEGKI